MAGTTFLAHHLGPDTHANRPSATGLPDGVMYACTTHNKIERVVSGAWADYYAFSGGTGVAGDAIWDAKGDLAAASGADTAARLAVGSDGQVLTADAASTLGVKWAAAGSAGALTLLSTTTLSGAGTFDVSSISGSYNDLILVVIARSSYSGGVHDTIALRLNNDSAANYYREMIQVTGTGTVSGVETVGTTGLTCGDAPGSSGTLANSFGMTEILIPGYASTTWVKNVIWDNFGADTSASTNLYVVRGGGLWNSTAAVTRVQINTGQASTFVTGSQLRIYGRL